MSKSVLITGGAGYVGFSLTRKLAESHRVSVVDNFSNSRTTAQRLLDMGVTVEQVDIRDCDGLAQVIASIQPDCIIHLAALHFIPACEKDPLLCFATNVEGTINIAALCPPSCRLVSVSSGAVYRPSNEPHHEQNSVVQPDDFYGISKLHGEHYVRYFSEKHGFPAVVVRLFNVVGPGETNLHVVPEIVAQILAGRREIRLGNTEPKRDFIHVEDVAEGLISAGLDGEVPAGTTVTVNLGTGKQYSVTEVLDFIGAAAGIELSIAVDPGRLRRSDRPFMSANIEGIERLFGWSPRRSLEKAIADLMAKPEIPQNWIEMNR